MKPVLVKRLIKDYLSLYTYTHTQSLKIMKIGTKAEVEVYSSDINKIELKRKYNLIKRFRKAH